MKIAGCDLHARQQSIATVDTETGEVTEKTLSHEGNAVREPNPPLGKGHLYVVTIAAHSRETACEKVALIPTLLLTT